MPGDADELCAHALDLLTGTTTATPREVRCVAMGGRSVRHGRAPWRTANATGSRDLPSIRIRAERLERGPTRVDGRVLVDVRLDVQVLAAHRAEARAVGPTEDLVGEARRHLIARPGVERRARLRRRSRSAARRPQCRPGRDTRGRRPRPSPRPERGSACTVPRQSPRSGAGRGLRSTLAGRRARPGSPRASRRIAHRPARTSRSRGERPRDAPHPVGAAACGAQTSPCLEGSASLPFVRGASGPGEASVTGVKLSLGGRLRPEIRVRPCVVSSDERIHAMRRTRSSTLARTLAAAALASLATVLVLPSGGGAVTQARPDNTAEPRISGAATVGATLSATQGSWANTPTSFAYQWVRCPRSGGQPNGSDCAVIGGATTSSYVVATADVDRRLRVRVTAANADGSATAASNATPVIANPDAGRPGNVAATDDLGHTVAGPDAPRPARHLDRPAADHVHVQLAPVRHGGQQLHPAARLQRRRVRRPRRRRRQDAPRPGERPQQPRRVEPADCADGSRNRARRGRRASSRCRTGSGRFPSRACPRTRASSSTRPSSGRIRCDRARSRSRCGSR